MAASSGVVQALQTGLSEISSINKRIDAAKELKNTDKQNGSLEALYKKYFDMKAQTIDRYRNSLGELEKLIESNRIALLHQQRQRDSIQAELLVEEKVADDEHKITRLKSDLSSNDEIMAQLSTDKSTLEAIKSQFLDAVQQHGFDRKTLTAPYDVVGIPSPIICPRCKSKGTVSYLDKSPNPQAKCSSCGNVWKT